MLTQPSAPIRLLIAEPSENQAYQLDSMLRDAGIATRPEIITDLADIKAVCGDARQDLMIWRSGFGNLEALLPSIKEHQPELPVILLTDAEEGLSRSQAMALGAADVVDAQDHEHLLHVIRREVNNVCQRHRLVQTRRALKEAEQRCQLLLANTHDAIAYVHEGMHIYANDAYHQLFGFSDAEEMLGLPLMDLIANDSTAAFKQQMKTFRESDSEAKFAFSGKTAGGEPVTGTMVFAAAEYEGETCIQVTVRTDEINGLGHANGAPVAQSSPSWGLEGFADEVDALRRQRGGRCCAIGVIEIDKFDDVQIESGIRAAIDLASNVAELVAGELADDGAFARIDAHRLAAAWLCDDDAANHLRAEQMRSAVERALFDIDEITMRTTVSVGVTSLKDEADAERAIDDALKTLVANRDTNGNKVHWDALGSTGDAKDLESDEAMRILGLVNNAIEAQSFVLLFQPIISLRGDSDEHYEVFLRLPDESGDELLPRDFLKLAIDNGVAGKIDRWVILQSIKLLSVHRSRGHNTRLTINLTANSICDEEFVQWLGVAIKAARLPSDAVIFQITEPDATKHLTQARTFLQGLETLHCRASLSRFGVGEHSLETARHLPVEFVKLDGTLVEGIDEDNARRDVLHKLITQLQSNGKLTIVPMVETAIVLSSLWQAGVNYIQGHYLQEPSTQMDYDFTSDD